MRHWQLRLIGVALVALALTTIEPYLVVVQARALTTSLISFWECENDFTDAHGSNDLTETGGTVDTPAGKVGDACDFEAGDTEFLSHTSNSDLQTGDIDFTFAAWVNFEDAVGGMLLAKDDSGARDYTFDYSGTIRFYINGSIIAAGPSMSVATWYYVIGEHEAGADRVRVQVNNGTINEADTGGVAPNTTASAFEIGARAFPGNEDYIDGLIDQVGFWKRILTTQERTDLYNSGNGLSYAAMAGDAAAPCLMLLLGVGKC